MKHLEEPTLNFIQSIPFDNGKIVEWSGSYDFSHKGRWNFEIEYNPCKDSYIVFRFSVPLSLLSHSNNPYSKYEYLTHTPNISKFIIGGSLQYGKYYSKYEEYFDNDTMENRIYFIEKSITQIKVNE
jgi:hypothetical protein